MWLDVIVICIFLKEYVFFVVSSVLNKVVGIL